MLQIIQNSAFTHHQKQYVPLKQVTVQANIRSFAADVTIKQLFRNDETIPIEAVYCFPIEEQAAIYAFSAHIDDRQIIAQLKEKQQAQQEYNDAFQQGHAAYLLEQDEKSQDNFIINLGALPSGKECHIQISYVTQLDLVQHGKNIRFVIPTTIAPRYNPDKGTITSPANTTTNYVQSAPYTIDFHCQVNKMNVTRVSSSSHPIQVDLSQEDVYVIEFARTNTHLDRDILLDIELSSSRSNTILAVESNAIMASFTPNEQDCQHAMNNNEVTNEFVFVVDCSGSMEDENKIGFARQAMLLFLKSLPLNCHFNIIRFGSNYETLFSDITDIYNKENAQQAEQLINNIRASLGGTELLPPLQWLKEHPSKENRARQVFLLTDGEISNVDEVLDLCRSMLTSTRIFSFGLGRSPSRSLVKGLARATNGHFVFIPPDTSVDIYVGEQLEKALQSSITNVQVKWNVGRNVKSIPIVIPPVYVNDRLIVYALTDDDDDDNNEGSVFDHNSSVELYNDKGRLGEAKVNEIPNISDSRTIGRLAAKALILELQHSKVSSSTNKKSGSRQARFEEQRREEREKVVNDEKEEKKKRIIELSLKYNILSPYTGFVGIEKRMNGDNAEMELREIPIQISADDQHLISPVFTSMPLSSVAYSPPQMYVMNSMADSRDDCWMDMSKSDIYTTDIMQLHSFDMFESSIPRCLQFSDDDIDVSGLSEYSDNAYNITTEVKKETFPTGDQDIVRYLISKQAFDGLWDLDSQDIEQLTGKPLSHFQQSTNVQVVTSTIAVLMLETHFALFSLMWYGVVQKARKSLLNLLGNDNQKLNSLFDDIRQQL